MIDYKAKEKWGERKKKIFLFYVKTEQWRNIGANYIATINGWLSINTMKDAFLVGAMAKLTIFKNIPMFWFMVTIFVLGVIAEVVKIYFGYRIWKSGLIKTQNEWLQNHEINNPFNQYLRDQLTEIAKKVGAIIKK